MKKNDGLMNWLKKLLAVFLIAFISTLAIAQERNVTGKVTEAGTNNVIPGVTVVEVGTTNGTITDVNGNFAIKVNSGAQLEFSFIANEDADNNYR